jgi:3-isopropylmalate/(R)-2-methylmalate dehydratase small subunit
MIAVVNGRARRFGNDINTDYIISSSRKRETIDANVLKRWLLEGADPAFAATVHAGDLIVAGRNFGCGSAMEVAVTVILAAGIRAVLAESFSRTFFRNAVNNGLIPVHCDTTHIAEGNQLEVAFANGRFGVRNFTTGETVAGAALSGIALTLLDDGGLVPHIRRHGGRFEVQRGARDTRS